MIVFLTSLLAVVVIMGAAMHLIEGPFRSFRGAWHFTALEERASKVELDVEFELAGGITALVIGGVFSEAANHLVDAFCKRADELSV